MVKTIMIGSISAPMGRISDTVSPPCGKPMTRPIDAGVAPRDAKGS
jgi:hypothetical protein